MNDNLLALSPLVVAGTATAAEAVMAPVRAAAAPLTTTQLALRRRLANLRVPQKRLAAA